MPKFRTVLIKIEGNVHSQILYLGSECITQKHTASANKNEFAPKLYLKSSCSSIGHRTKILGCFMKIVSRAKELGRKTSCTNCCAVYGEKDCCLRCIVKYTQNISACNWCPFLDIFNTFFLANSDGSIKAVINRCV